MSNDALAAICIGAGLLLQPALLLAAVRWEERDARRQERATSESGIGAGYAMLGGMSVVVLLGIGLLVGGVGHALGWVHG